MTDELVRLKDVDVSYGEVLLMQGINFTLRRGERVVLKGPSGCGKTTLLRVINGLIDTKGEMFFKGSEVCEVCFPSYRRQVTLVSQKPVLFDASVEENLRRPFSYKITQKEYPTKRAEKLLEDLGLAGKMAQNAKTLSVGQQQRVCLIRALLLEPEVLLLDEPTSALDPESVDFTERMILSELEERNSSAIIVSHDHAQHRRLATRVIDLRPFCVSVVSAVERGR